MTDKQKEQVRLMRWRGISYKEIAYALHLSKSSIRTHCVRHSLSDEDMESIKITQRDFSKAAVCKHCGQPLEQSGKHKPRQFCSDKCRFAWWNAHRDICRKKGTEQKSCVGCGMAFFSYDSKRKYCSHQCYIRTRFGG